MAYTLAADPTPVSTPVVRTPVVSTTSSYAGALTDSCAKSPTACLVTKVLHTAGLVAGVFHGYRRNRSIGWAIGWGLLGSIFPYITIPVAFAQGFGKPQVA